MRPHARRDLPEIVCVSADFLAAFPLKVLVDLSSFYFGFDFFSDIKRYEKLLLVFHETAIITRVKVSEAIFYNLIP